MGAWKTCCSLVADPALSGPTVRVCFRGGGPCTALSLGLRAGAWSPSLDGDLGPQDRRVMGWSFLCLVYKRGVCFRGT